VLRCINALTQRVLYSYAAKPAPFTLCLLLLLHPAASPCWLQTEATYWARPRAEGIDLDASLNGLDLLLLAASAGAAPPLDPLSSGQPVRARCSGQVRMSLRPTAAGAAAAGGADAAGNSGDPPMSSGRRPAAASLSYLNPSVMFEGGPIQGVLM
jgi:hypothetical protein